MKHVRCEQHPSRWALSVQAVVETLVLSGFSTSCTGTACSASMHRALPSEEPTVHGTDQQAPSDPSEATDCVRMARTDNSPRSTPPEVATQAVIHQGEGVDIVQAPSAECVNSSVTQSTVYKDSSE